MFYTGILSSFGDPAGLGLGATTIASSKLGGDDAVGGSTEIDISNLFVSLGPVGGLVYVVVVFYMFQTTIRYVLRTNSVGGIAVLALLVAITGNWLTGSQYAVVAIVWLCIGMIDQLNKNWEREQLPA